MPTAGNIERACELFYSAIADIEALPQALDAIAAVGRSRGATIFPMSLGHPTPICSSGSADYLAAFVAEGWAASNSRMKRGLELTLAGYRGIITDTDMFTPEELRRDRFYNEFIHPRKMGSTAGIVLARSGSNLALPIALDRWAAEGSFQPSDVVRLNQLMSLIAPAANLALQLGLFRSRAFADALAATGKDVLLLSNTGKILHVTPSCERHFNNALVVRDARLHSWQAAADRSLTVAIARATQRATTVDRVADTVVLPRQHGGAPIRAQVVPLVRASEDIFALARAAVIVRDPDIGAAETTNSLASLGLSPAEIRLARHVGRGETLASAADRERITRETARTRLKAIFAKTGTHRQSQLVLLVNGLGVSPKT